MSASVDREIDHVVRELTDVEAPAALRGRVLASIDRPARTRWEWIAAPVTAAALVVLALMLRPPSSLQSMPIAQVVAAPRVADARGFRVEAEHTGVLPAQSGSHVARSYGRRGDHGSRGFRLEAEEQRASTIAIAPLAGPAPIVVRPVQPRALEHPEVAIDALSPIAPIAIERLPQGGRH